MLIEFIQPDFTFNDDRGTLLQLVHQGWTQVNYITSKAGVARGHHYHKHNREAFYVVSGEFRLNIEDVHSGAQEHHIMKTGDFFVINAYLSHSFEFTLPTALISFYDHGVEESAGQKDIHALVAEGKP